jgi:multiple antibiotic resistance protein
VGIAPLYLGLTTGDDPATQRRVALIASFAVAVTLLVVLLVGRLLLQLFDISIDDLRVAGGLIVLLIALSMLNAKPSPVHAGEADLQQGKAKQSPAVVPLAIPMLSGPGAMATVIVTKGDAKTILGDIVMMLVIVVDAVIVYLVLRAAVPLEKRLGESGMNIIVRVMGLILAAIAVDMMATGSAASSRSWVAAPERPSHARSRQAEALDPTNARLPVDEDRLRHDQGLRGHAHDPAPPLHADRTQSHR